MIAPFVSFLIAAIIAILRGVKVDLGDLANWDMMAIFFIALGLALSLLPPSVWPIVRRPAP